MRKADSAYRVLIALTLFFALIAALSFAAFRETKTLCTDASQKCTETVPGKNNGGQMLWDDFSRRFVSVTSLR